MTQPSISKSQYLKGLQCPKALWLYRNRKDLKPDIAADQQALFDAGETIGKLAMRYFGDEGIEVKNDYWDIQGAIDTTKTLIAQGKKVIFEATAMHPVNGGYSRIDALRKVENTDQWDMIEVKSSTQVKEYHIEDMSFQYHVFSAAGYNIRKCYMMLLDSDYVRNGDLDPTQLFKLEDISDDVFARQALVEDVAGQLGYIVERIDEPVVDIGARCSAPFDCEYKGYCWANVPDYSIFNIFQAKKAEELMRTYGPHIENLPDTIRPNGAKYLDLESYLSGKIIHDAASIVEFIKGIQYPLYFLDYETLMPSIPVFDGTRPFQQIPFQFSVHVQKHEGATLGHSEYLHKERTDPRSNFASELVRLCGSEGTVIVYNQAFEITRNKELARDFPLYAEAIAKINDRIIDLLIPFRQRWLYHPDQKGSASIKAVLPAFTDLKYDDLEISNGGEAMTRYTAFMNGDLEPEQLPDLWKDLSAYCGQDTYAMVLLLDVLRKYAE